MKTYLCFLFASLSLCSCTTESEDIKAVAADSIAVAATAYKKGTPVSNASNPYDYAGQTVYDLLGQYDSLPDVPKTLAEVKSEVEGLLLAHKAFAGTLPGTHQFPALATVEELVSSSGADLPADLALAGYTGKSVLYLQGVATGLDSLKQSNAPYADVYQFITGMENNVRSDNLPPREEAAVLITLSILRYALYQDTRKRRRDRDWEWSTANIAATGSGAISNIPNALLLSVVSKVYQP